MESNIVQWMRTEYWKYIHKNAHIEISLLELLYSSAFLDPLHPQPRCSAANSLSGCAEIYLATLVSFRGFMLHGVAQAESLWRYSLKRSG